MCSRRACSLAVIASAAWAAPARGDVQIPFSPRLSATLSNGQQAIEAGVERTIGGAPVGIVGPGATGGPPLVMRTVPIAPPGASPTLTARVSCPYAPWPDTQILIGPSLSHAFTGADRAMSPFGGSSGRAAGELWLY